MVLTPVFSLTAHLFTSTPRGARHLFLWVGLIGVSQEPNLHPATTVMSNEYSNHFTTPVLLTGAVGETHLTICYIPACANTHTHTFILLFIIILIYKTL